MLRQQKQDYELKSQELDKLQSEKKVLEKEISFVCLSAQIISAHTYMYVQIHLELLLDSQEYEMKLQHLQSALARSREVRVCEGGSDMCHYGCVHGVGAMSCDYSDHVSLYRVPPMKMRRK